MAYIDDPFDPPGEARFGGGQEFIFEFGRCLVRRSYDVTYVTQLNDPSKSKFERLGPRCRIHRIAAGAIRDRAGEEAGADIDELTDSTLELFEASSSFDTLYAQYWVSGEIALRFRRARQETTPIFYYPLSFGRAKRGSGPHSDPLADLRERIEPNVLRECDAIVVGSPEERDLLSAHYPEITTNQILLAPLWYDAYAFRPRPECSFDYVRRATRRFSEGA